MYNKVNKTKRQYYSRKQKIKRQADPNLALIDRMRAYLSRWFKKSRTIKIQNTFNTLGFSPQVLYNHLMTYFENDCIICNDTLTLYNYEIDHIVPIGMATTQEEIIMLNQIDNLRLICRTCNRRKSSSDKCMIKEKKNKNDRK